MKLRSDEYLWNICMKIYREMYKKATPSANFDELIKKGITKKRNWFMNYYLPKEEQEKIVEKYLKKYKCSKIEKDKIRFEIWLGCSPRAYPKERVKKAKIKHSYK